MIVDTCIYKYKLNAVLNLNFRGLPMSEGLAGASGGTSVNRACGSVAKHVLL